MIGRYRMLFVVTVAIGLALVAVGRWARRGEAPRQEAPPAPVVELSLEVADGAVRPATTAVPKDSRVALHVVNLGPRAVRFTLDAYEDRVRIDSLASGATWRGELLADRPGEDFSWRVDGQPAGRLAVTGSHLVEGHR